MKKPAKTSVSIHPILNERWSPRAFDTTHQISEEDITAILEAGRWAPSANNNQPWRFIVARKGDKHFQSLKSKLMGFNQSWVPDASLFIVVNAITKNAEGGPIFTALYDAGLAAGLMTVEAAHRGLVVHQVGGYDRAAVKAEYGMDDSMQTIAILVIGKQAPAEALGDETLRAREQAERVRKPLEELILNS